MKRILDNKLLRAYIDKHNIEKIFHEDLIKTMELHFYEKDESIFIAEDNLEYYYLLVEGRVRISYLFENGKAMILKVYRPFNTIGDLELLKSRPITCDIEAMEDTYLIAISSDILRRNYLDNPQFLRHLVESLSEKLYATINNSSYNFVYPLINRLASYLVDCLGDKGYIDITSSLLQISQFLGTTYRHLNRTIKELEEKEIIKYKDKKIYVLDEAKLRELSKNLYI